MWFAWPINIPLLPTAHDGAPRIVWATAQLATQIQVSDKGSVVFLVQTEGIQPELGLSTKLDSSIQPAGGATASSEGDYTVLRAIRIGTAPFAVVLVDGVEVPYVLCHSPISLRLMMSVVRVKVSLVMLPFDAADRLWTGNLAGKPRVMLSESSGSSIDADASMLLTADHDPATLHVRTRNSSSTFWICPTVSLNEPEKGTAVSSSSDGVFTKFELETPQSEVPIPKIVQMKPAGPARKV